MESEIFGHVRGAFTGATEDRAGAAELADGGTLFLDEIAEMDLALQAKLLRFVQTGTLRRVGGSELRRVDVRIVSATNRDPLAEVEAGRFRADLFYRLHVLPIHLAPLRERAEDILPLAQAFLARYAAEEGRAFQGFDAETAEYLLAQTGPAMCASSRTPSARSSSSTMATRSRSDAAGRDPRTRVGASPQRRMPLPPR